MTPNPALNRTRGHVCSSSGRRAPVAAGRLANTLGRALGAVRRSEHNSPVKVSEILRMLHDDGWLLVVTRGSHRQFKHPNKPGRVTVPGKPSDELAPGTLNSIRKQSGIKK